MNNNTITIFEHEALYVHRGDQKLTDVQLRALQLFYKERDFPYYTLVHNGVRFCEYVGVIKVGSLTIEILPKADRNNDKVHWRSLLIDMMRSIGLLHPDVPSYANLKLKQSNILDLYLELFIDEVERVVRKGLVKKYRKIESNNTALKGKLLIGKQLTKNIVHQERFYVEHSVYDKEHLLHQIIQMALNTVIKIGTTSHLISRYKRVLIDFPEQKAININEGLFEKIRFDRKTQDYQSAIDIAKIILLNYHPDLNTGNNRVLALMFDMNMLWERFVLKSLQRHQPDQLYVSGQERRDFWRSDIGNTKRIKPDIVLRTEKIIVAVLDTKWKNIGDGNPSDDDLRQLYAYSRYHNNAPSYLVYPGDENRVVDGKYHKTFENDNETPGGIIKLKIQSGRKDGMDMMKNNMLNYLKIISTKNNILN